MIALVADAVRSISGVWHLLLGRPHFPAYFDVSPDGVWRSFGAALLAAPAYVLMLAAQHNATVELGYASDIPTAIGIARSLALYLAVWAHFPLLAPVLARFAGRPEALAPWIVVHNWTVLALLIGQTAIWMLYALHVMPAEALGAFMYRVYLPISLLVHWRVALKTLSVGWGMAAGLAFAHVLANVMTQQLVASAFAGPAQ